MPKEALSPTDTLARPTKGDVQRPVLLDDPQNAARQRFLDEIIGRPPVGPQEKLQVIRQNEDDKQAAAAKKTPAEIAQTYERKAHSQLDQVHQALKFTTDRYEPKVVPFQNAYRVPSDTTPADIAKARLGANASEDQIRTYVNALNRLNKMDGAAPDKPISKDTILKLPGQRSNGAIFYRDKGATVSEWYDGSIERLTERGRGSVRYMDKDGANIEISWNPERATDTNEVRTKDKTRTDITADGTTIDKVKSDRGTWDVSKVSTSDGKGRAVVAEFEPGKKSAERITITDSDKNQIRLKWDGRSEYVGDKLNAKGEVVERDVHAQATRSGLSIFWLNERADNKGTTRTYEDGTAEDFDAADELTERRGTDAWGRKVTERYESDEALPYEIEVALKDKESLTFTRQPFGFYSAPCKDKDGKEIGTVDLRRNGLIVYNNDAEQTAEAVLPDGTKMVRRTLPDAKTDITETKDGATLHRTVDRNGTVVDAEYTDKDGRKIYRKLSADGGSVEKVTITEPNKAQTELSYDRDLGLFTGNRKDKDGKELDKCFYFQGKVVYRDVNSGESRFEKLNFFERDLFGLKVSPGTYDPLTGTISMSGPDGSRTVESFSPGRTDVHKDGVVSGTTVTGERSMILPSGEAVVHNPDDSGVRLNGDGSVDRWGHEDVQNAQEEPLTRVEGEYLRKHADVDRRDLLAIHAAYHDEPAKLDAFYQSLSKLDDANNLTPEEKKALRKDIMHHVGFPAELYQGNTWCCNVAVVERDMAMNSPDKYAEILISALNDGKVKLPDGTELPTDKSNLKVIDSSGRDFASRAFQTIAIQAKYYPKYSFMNTEDGVGRLMPGNDKHQPAAFVGLNMDEIAAVRHRLTGENKAVVAITSPDDLFLAWKENKGRSMTIAVNADEAPFSDGGGLAALFGGQTESKPNHVVSITRMEEGPPPIAYVQNQWGLQNDLSTPARAVPVETLLASMIGRVRDTTGRIVPTPAQALTTGQPGKTYFVKDGKLVEEKRRK